MSKIPKTNLSIYLLKKDCNSHERAIRLKKNCTEYALKFSDESPAALFVQPQTPSPPSWLGFVKPALREEPSLINRSSAAVLIIKRGERSFAVTFGYGKSLLHPGTTEENFGLKVTLNSIDVDGIRSLETLRFDAISCQTRAQSHRQGTPEQFGVDRTQDLVRAISGKPSDTKFGTRISGADGLQISVPIRIDDLTSLLDETFEAYNSDAYKEHFRWIDQIAFVKDPAVIDSLNENLLRALHARQFEKLYLAVPQIIKWANTAGFRYKPKRGENYDDLDIRQWLEECGKSTDEVDIKTLKNRCAYQMGTASETTLNTWPIYKCINFETDLDGSTHLLVFGQWYRVDREFVNRTNRSAASIPELDGELPDYDDNGEPEYNRRVAQQSGGEFALMDGPEKIICHGGGQSRIEFCDLYTNNPARLIHVKRFTGSSTLSHLFSQGVVSGELFLSDGLFREKVNEKLPDTHRLADTASKPEACNFDIVYAIVSNSDKALTDSLPFFSKVALVAAYDRLKLYGYTVKLLKIKNLRRKLVGRA